MIALALLLAVVIDHQPASTKQYIGSPSIAILTDGSYVTSHDFFGPGSTQSHSAVTRVFRSTDRGATWKQSAEFSDQFWSNLFVHKKKLYLMGTTYEYGRIVIRRSDDGGATWSAPSYLTEDTGYHTAPVPIVEKNGRLWRAFEWHPEGPWGFFEAFVISAPVKADLMDPKSWTRTERLKFNAPEGHHWLEGNVVLTRKGKLVNILRVNNIEKAAILNIEPNKLVFDRVVEFPGGAKKFTIRWDRKSRKYWTLVNPAPGAPNPTAIRNTLAIAWSKDLDHWTLGHVILSNPDPIKHAYQYVDWQFDGNDIVAAVRTADDDEEGGAHRGHDANFLTFERIKNFRN